MITSKDFLINFGKTPTEDSEEFNLFWDNELKKCQTGITIDGVFFNPFLYWHCNLWTIISDDLKSGYRIKQKPTLRDSEWLLTNKIWEAETWKDEYGNIRKKGVIAAGTRRFSKALEHGSKLYTLDGEIFIENAKIGDKIFGANGKLTTIIDVIPQGIKDIYEITLLDGRKLYCCEDHLWNLYTKKTGKLDRIGDKLVTLSTKELIKRYKKERKNSHKPGEKSFEYFYSIPNNKAVEYQSKELKIPPYILGLWLGDGSKKGADFTTIDQEILDYIENYAKSLGLVVKKDRLCYRVTSGVQGGKEFDRNILLNNLRYYNLTYNKHIPKDYLYSSVEDRLELLRGLMDTDGTISKDGECSFSSSIPKLSDDFYFLCRSLGINVRRKIRKSRYKKNNIYKECKDSNHFQLYVDFSPFKLSRKIKRFRLTKGMYPKINKTKIINIEKVRQNYATCIAVDNADHLYLTDNFTVTHNTELEASFCAWKAVCWRYSQVLVSGLNEPDIKIITDRIDLGLNELPNYFVKSKVEDNWKKQVSLGYKDKITNERNVWSTFAIRNFDGGANEEALAGLTPSGGVIDEGGKGSFLKALLAGLPGLSTANGWRGTFLVMGTGGDMESFNDFKTLFDDPDSYNFLAVDIPDENRKCGLFLPGYMSYAYPKEKKSLAEFLNVPVKENPNLSKIEILVSNKEANEKLIDKERALASKSADNTALLKTTMYFPKNTREIFMSSSNNKFPKEAIEQRIIWLENHYKPLYADFFRNSKGNVEWKHSDLKPLNKFPIVPTDFKEAPVCIYELPVKNAPAFTYAIGGDPINNNESNDKIVSLGSIYVYKRMLSPLDQFKNQVVCSWAGRFSELKEFHELFLMIAEYYNAIGSVLPEASENTLIQFFKYKRKAHYFADSVDLQRNVINSKTKSSAKVGLPPSTPNQRHYMNLMVEEANEELITLNDDGDEEFTYGVGKEHDIMLLTEMLNYKGKSGGQGVHDGNYDRLIGYGCALTLAKYFDTKYEITNKMPQLQQEEKTYYTPKVKQSILGRIEIEPRKQFGFQEPKQISKNVLPIWMRS